MTYFNNPASTLNITILINLLPKRPAPKRRSPKSHVPKIVGPRAKIMSPTLFSGKYRLNIRCVFEKIAGKPHKQMHVHHMAPRLIFSVQSESTTVISSREMRHWQRTVATNQISQPNISQCVGTE